MNFDLEQVQMNSQCRVINMINERRNHKADKTIIFSFINKHEDNCWCLFVFTRLFRDSLLFIASALFPEIGEQRTYHTFVPGLL